MTCYDGLDSKAAAAFCRRWLPAWTGNDPERLVSFYAEDAFYRDPARPKGLSGRAPLLAYFRALLARYPHWVWSHCRSLPLPGGFLNYWSASVDGRTQRTFGGVCVVQLRQGLIINNEVFFDPGDLARTHRDG